MEKKATPLRQTYIYFHRGVDLPAYYVIMTCLARRESSLYLWNQQKWPGRQQWFGDFENVGKGFPKQQHVFFWLPIVAFFGDGCATFIQEIVFTFHCLQPEKDRIQEQKQNGGNLHSPGILAMSFLRCLYIYIFSKIHVNTTTMQLWMGYYHVRKSKDSLNQEHSHCMRDVFAVYDQILDGRNPANKQCESWFTRKTHIRTAERLPPSASCYSSSNNHGTSNWIHQRRFRSQKNCGPL